MMKLKKKTIMINLHKQLCNSINDDVIFLDEIKFNVMTMMFIYY
jgi:hypothetical protein